MSLTFKKDLKIKKTFKVQTCTIAEHKHLLNMTTYMIAAGFFLAPLLNISGMFS